MASQPESQSVVTSGAPAAPPPQAQGPAGLDDAIQRLAQALQRTDSPLPLPGTVAAPASVQALGAAGSKVALAGLIVAAIIVIGALAAAGVLCFVVINSSLNTSPNPLILRLLLSCVAMFIAMGFAGLGFGLFLIGAEGLFKLTGTVSTPNSTTPARAALESTAPGLIVVVCATVILWGALQITFEVTQPTSAASVTPSPPAPEPELLGGDLGFLDRARAPSSPEAPRTAEPPPVVP
ncbi:hypothetical protein MYSTI_01844 [Myxococcus stipitatus DSM 14675]|uniref:Uncharacterized protein n=1 Tax=Myxococcus stipitatus (strain DSM 14675 / JCM 12634 / Mx s8) TaxID=1278073 RepID=L7U317_MYXSD|nr:hypothetical protein [Myxococcus stipitatus]AGC43176.1 hypothetical protein MYSTI_01844 [Myxococcus stipitatus DSM 14675]